MDASTFRPCHLFTRTSMMAFPTEPQTFCSTIKIHIQQSCLPYLLHHKRISMSVYPITTYIKLIDKPQL